MGDQLLMAATLDGAVCLLRFEEIFVRFVQPAYHSVFVSDLLIQGLALAIDLRFILVVSRCELSYMPFLSPRFHRRYRDRPPGMQTSCCAPEVVHA